MPMPKNEWSVINDARDYLKSNLAITNKFLDDLISEKVLDPEDQQRICLEPKYGQFEKLIYILKHKPSECKAFVKLKKVLRSDAKFIADELEKTEKKFPQDTTLPGLEESDVDTSVHKLKDRIRQVLVEKFDSSEGQVCPLAEVIEIVSETVTAEGFHYNWNVDYLRNFVIDEVFVGVTFEKRKKKKPASFRNLGIKKQEEVTLTEQHAAASGDAETKTPGQDQLKLKSRISDMSAADLVGFLKPNLSEFGIEGATMQKMITEGIDGKAFILLEKQDLKNDFPEITLGQRIKFMHLKQTVLEETIEMTTEHEEKVEQMFETSTDMKSGRDQMYSDKFHQFDTEVGSVDSYVKGRLLEVEGHTRGSLIMPRRHFICPTEEGTELCRKIARETVIFASACMNERANGTLHAGVCPPATSDGKPGEILGLNVDRAECDKVVKNFIKESFYEDQLDVAETAIRNVKFIQVFDPIGTKNECNLFVVEIDVVPSATLVGNDAFFVKTQLLGNRRKKRKQDLYRLFAGKPEPQSDENVIAFMDRKQKLTELRVEHESNKLPTKYNIDLRKQILNLFTGGSDTIEDDIYPVLFTSPLDLQMDQVYLKENLSFIQHFDSRVIFDFDPSSSDKGLYKFFDEEKNQCFTVLTTDNFKNREIKENKEVSTAHKAWIFSNGYSTLKMDGLQPFGWKQERSEGYKEALRFYHQNIPNERGIAIIFLFSKHYEVMLEAAEEVLLKFKDQWMVIAENEDIADLWKRELLRRNVVKKESLEERCVIGMPWHDVNKTFIDVLQPLKVTLCQVPLSTGAFRELTEKDKNAMCDLEILSSNECGRKNEIPDKNQTEDLRTKVEEKFFRGGTVEWWNFWFGEDHVKKRQLHSDLVREVESALSTQKADEIVLVTLLHQPGAGGTTSSRQVLWDLRERYKCCLLKRITDDTAEQIASLRRYGESSNPRPPLILVDNEDEEHVDRLLVELEDKARINARKNEDSNNVFCVLLHCERRASLPHSHEGRQLHLRHDLSAQELLWFRRKYDELKKKSEEDNGVDPKLLISFNLLKNNFNPQYVQRTVRMLMKDITSDKELRLLRYLSFLNTYDLDFRALPVACFDLIMETEGIHMRSIRKKCWETKLGSSIRVLLNESSNRLYGATISSIRIISSVLSKEILASFKLQALSDILLEILESELFEVRNNTQDYLMGVISTMVKKRAKNVEKFEKSSGEKFEKSHTEKFAPLILEIMTKEGPDRAAEVFIEVFKMKNDPMVAQQLARLYIHYRNWPEAERYASIATRLFKTNSFLWDTHAQVYEQQLRAKAEAFVTREVVTDSLTLVYKAIESYRRVQKVSVTEINRPYNYYGYFGEVRVTIYLVEVLWKYMDSLEESDRHAFLVDPDFVPYMFGFLEQDDIEFIKASGRIASWVIERLEEVLLQLKPDTKQESPQYYVSLNKLMEIKEQLFKYYGENTDDVPAKLSLEEQCEFRRRRVRKIGATSLQGLLQLRFKNKDETDLVRVYKLMMQNVDTSMCISFDLCTVLNTIVAMSRYDDAFVKTIPFTDILDMSQRLIEVRNKDLLESFLYVLLFNVPTPSRLNRGYNLCQSSTIRDTIKLWKEAFYDKYPRQREEQKCYRKKDTTLFFLGHGDGVGEIVHHKQLAVREEDLRANDDFWHTQIAREKFLRYEGTLLMDGMEVKAIFQSQKGNKYDICIPTSMPVKRIMWQKKVYFVLGFSWSGPKAYDVTLDDPSKLDLTESEHQQPCPPMIRSDNGSPNPSGQRAPVGRHKSPYEAGWRAQGKTKGGTSGRGPSGSNQRHYTK